jgi:hypothetical protein
MDWYCPMCNAPLPLEGSMTTKAAAPETPPATEKDPFEGLVPGRIVHYWPQPYEERHCEPGPWAAIVTFVPKPVDGVEFVPGVVTLNVQLPAPANVGTDPVIRISHVHYSAEKLAGCWSWIPR